MGSFSFSSVRFGIRATGHGHGAAVLGNGIYDLGRGQGKPRYRPPCPVRALPSAWLQGKKVHAWPRPSAPAPSAPPGAHHGATTRLPLPFNGAPMTWADHPASAHRLTNPNPLTSPASKYSEPSDRDQGHKSDGHVGPGR
ncbi:hypothetical protein ABZP36_008198 [Zizania latifolia]